jgi:ABC-type polysaccharide/polyol phosphate export permease
MSLSTRTALHDIAQAFKSLDMALFLAWDDIRERYVRTFLGPLWIVLSTGIWFAVMGFVMGNIFQQHLSDYLPYLVCGLVIWLLISSCISEGSIVLIVAKRIITSYHLPIFTNFLRFIIRNQIIFLHNAVILIIVLMIFPPPLSANQWLIIPGMVLNTVILTSGAVLLSLANIRYRDTHMVITNALQVLPYVTPIFWHREMLKGRTWVADWNPVYHMIEIMRGPLIGTAPSHLSWMVTMSLALVLPVIAVAAFVHFRHRIIFWI